MKKYKENYLALVYQELVPVLLRFGLKICGNRALVEDCIQDVFLKLIGMDDITGIKNMKLYLLKSLKNNVLDKLARIPEDVYDTLAHDFQQEQSYEERMIESETTQDIKIHIENAIKRLTKRQKEIIYLRYFEQQTYEEICLKLGLEYQTVRNHMRSAHQQLKQMLEMRRPSYVHFFRKCEIHHAKSLGDKQMTKVHL